jgi:hypothetical protein
MPRKRTKLTQPQLDKLLRKAAGHNAIEEMVFSNAAVQKYLLSNGAILSIRTASGRTHVKGGR